MTSPNMSNFYFSQDEVRGENDYHGARLHVKHGSNGGKGELPTRSPSARGYEQYSVTIGSTPMSPCMEMASVTVVKSGGVEKGKNSRNRANDANAAAWGYTKVALLYFVSLLVTWVSQPLAIPCIVSIGPVYSLLIRSRSPPQSTESTRLSTPTSSPSPSPTPPASSSPSWVSGIASSTSLPRGLPCRASLQVLILMGVLAVGEGGVRCLATVGDKVLLVEGG